MIHSYTGLYGQSLNVYDWEKRTLSQTIDLGPDGKVPLEVRFLHNPKAAEGFTGCALSTNMFRFFKAEVKYNHSEVAFQFSGTSNYICILDETCMTMNVLSDNEPIGNIPVAS